MQLLGPWFEVFHVTKERHVVYFFDQIRIFVIAQARKQVLGTVELHAIVVVCKKKTTVSTNVKPIESHKD
jgi:hypothetical protein